MSLPSFWSSLLSPEQRHFWETRSVFIVENEADAKLGAFLKEQGPAITIISSSSTPLHSEEPPVSPVASPEPETVFINTPLSQSSVPTESIPAVEPVVDTDTLTVQQPGMIAGVQVSPLKIIANEQGQIMPMLRAESPTFRAFGEVYFAGLYSGIVKGWTIHERHWLNLCVPQGRVKFVLHDLRRESPTYGLFQELTLGDHNYQLLTVPPGLALAWKNIAPELALIATCSSGPLSAEETRRLPIDQLSYRW